MASTITEVSKSAGCSPATVSRVLNNSGPVSPHTREAVLRSARELGYTGGYQSRERRQNAVNTQTGRYVEVVLHRHDSIERVEVGSGGLQVDRLEDVETDSYFSPEYQLSNSFHRELINGVVSELKGRGLRAVVQIAEDLACEDLIRDINAPDKLGVLLMGEPGPEVERFCNSCARPLVLVDILHHDWPSVVTIDNFGGAALAVEHLVGLGHTKIAFSGWAQNPSFRERRNGFIAAMLDRGLDFNPEWSFEETVHIEDKAAELRQVFSQAARPTAIVCSNDYQALGAIRAAERAGLRVPHDLSVVGFDNIELAQFTSPSLTTIGVPLSQLGREAVRQLIVSSESRIGSDSASLAGCDVRIRTKLIERDSTASVAK